MLRSLTKSTSRDESGQALPLVALCLFVMLGFVAMSIDVGRFIWAKAQMQAAVDAAALAAAQSMPNEVEARAKAAEYWIDNSAFIQSQGENIYFNGDDAASEFFPPGNKAIRIAASAEIPTYFARLFGVDHWTVAAEGWAESQVLDISVVLDVSGSMCYDPPGVIHTESAESTHMSPGHPSPRPVLTQSIPAGGAANSIVIKLNTVAIFNSTNSTTNNTNFGYNSTDRYYQRTINGRSGIIAIWQNAGGGSGAYELFKITAVNTSTNELTVTRAQSNNWTGGSTSKISHAVNAEVWANRVGCDRAARNISPPYGLYPFDGTISNAEYFTTLFNPAYDKIGVARYSNTATTVQSLSSNLTAVKNQIHNFASPNGSTNIAHGIATGQKILDGPGKRANAVRVLVVLTDGIPNVHCTNSTAYTGTASCTQGSTATSPTTCSTSNASMNHSWQRATAAKNAGITVYVIGLGDGVLDCVLQQIADNGGGIYYKAPTVAQLDAAFEAIAEQTHIALIK